MMECQGALSCRRMTIVPASDIRRIYAPIAANLPFGSDMNMIMRAPVRGNRQLSAPGSAMKI